MRAEREEAIGLLARALAALAGLASRRPWLILGLTALSCVCALHYALTLQFHTHRNDLLSPHKDYYKRWQHYLEQFGDDQDMVIVVQGNERPRLVEAVEELAAEIQLQPEHFDRLFCKVDLRGLRDRALLFLSVDQIRSIQEGLKGMSLLLDPPVLGGLDPLFSWKSLSLLQLLHEGERRAGALAADKTPGEGDLDYLRQLGNICASAAGVLADDGQDGDGQDGDGQGSDGQGSDGYANPWKSILPASGQQHDLMARPQYFFSSDGTLAFLLVRALKGDTSQFTYARESIEAMRALVAQMRQRHPDLAFGLTGLPVLEHDEMTASQADASTASWLALAGVALLYLIVYRGIRYPLMTVATLLVGTTWALGWLTLTVGHLNILSSAFAVMLIGMGDYGVLWVTRYAQERQGGANLHQAMHTTAIHVGPSILTASLTTALAFFATMLADLKAVAELGWIAGSGILFCGLACFLVLPALLKVCDGLWRQRRNAATLPIEPYRLFKRQWLPVLGRRPFLVAGSCLAATFLLAILALGIRYDHNLLHMQAAHLDSVTWQKILLEKTTGASWHALSYTSTPEEALALKARYERLPEVSRVVEVASLIPADQERKLEMIRDIQYRLRRLPARGETIPHAPPEVSDLQRSGKRLLKILAQLEGQGPSFQDLKTYLHSFLTALGAVSRETAGMRLQAFEGHLARDLAEDLHQLREVATPRPIQVADLPTPLRQRYIGKAGQWLLCIYARESLWEYQPLKHFVAQVRAVDPEAFGNPFSTLEGLRAMRDGFLWASVYALVAMVLVLLVDFGNPGHTLIALVPLGMGLAAALGIMVVFGVPLNPANMIAFPLILGVGADNGVHVLHDFRASSGRASGGKRYSLSYATGRGIMVAALTTVLGFGTLMIAQHRGMASLGLILSLGVSCCMLSSLVFLPAFLRIISQRRRNNSEENRRLAA